MVIFQMTLHVRRPSSITVTTSAVRLTSQMIKLTKATAEARHNYSVALHKLGKLQSRRTPNMKLIRNAKSAMREARALYGTLVSFTTGVETVKKEVGKKVQSQLPKDYGGQ